MKIALSFLLFITMVSCFELVDDEDQIYSCTLNESETGFYTCNESFIEGECNSSGSNISNSSSSGCDDNYAEGICEIDGGDSIIYYYNIPSDEEDSLEENCESMNGHYRS